MSSSHGLAVETFGRGGSAVQAYRGGMSVLAAGTEGTRMALQFGESDIFLQTSGPGEAFVSVRGNNVSVQTYGSTGTISMHDI